MKIIFFYVLKYTFLFNILQYWKFSVIGIIECVCFIFLFTNIKCKLFFVSHFYFLRKPRVQTNSMEQLNTKRDLFIVFLFNWFILLIPCKTFWHKQNFHKWFSSFLFAFVLIVLVRKITLN